MSKPYLHWENRTAWAQALKVGDEICDCRYRHVRIAHLYPDYDDDGSFMDVAITTEDGHGCSALHCCDSTLSHDATDHPVPHELAELFGVFFAKFDYTKVIWNGERIVAYREGSDEPFAQQDYQSGTETWNVFLALNTACVGKYLFQVTRDSA